MTGLLWKNRRPEVRKNHPRPGSFLLSAILEVSELWETLLKLNFSCCLISAQISSVRCLFQVFFSKLVFVPHSNILAMFRRWKVHIFLKFRLMETHFVFANGCRKHWRPVTWSAASPTNLQHRWKKPEQQYWCWNSEDKNPEPSEPSATFAVHGNCSCSPCWWQQEETEQVFHRYFSTVPK